jgi:hypothetical protein
MEKPTRLTTREAAQALGCRKPSDALALLRAAGVSVTRCGASWLWETSEVERLAATLRKPAAPPARGPAQAQRECLGDGA